MKKLIWILPILFTGCATAHDYCMAHSEHYSSYQECYSERIYKQRALASSLSHMGDGLQNASHRTVNCTSYTDSFGVTQTTCQ